MEDRMFFLESNNDESKILAVACVMDGHNGHEIAEKLRARLVEVMRALISTNHGDMHSFKTALTNVVDEVDESSSTGDVGSTISCLMILRDGKYVVGNIGDSRVVIARSFFGELGEVWIPGIGAHVAYENATGRVTEIVRSDLILVVPDNDPSKKKAVRKFWPLNASPMIVNPITRDHKPSDPIERGFIESLDNGFVSSDGRLQGILAVSRSVGAKNLKPFVRAEMEFFEGEIAAHSGDTVRFILGTDGIWDIFPIYRVAEFDGAEDVIEAAKLAAQRRDNMALIFLELTHDDGNDTCSR